MPFANPPSTRSAQLKLGLSLAVGAIATALCAPNLNAQTVAPQSEPQRFPAMEQVEFGRFLVTQRCANCHAVSEDEDRFAAPLHNLFGRKAGSVDGKTYSINIKNLGIAWSPQTLDNWLEQTTFDTPDIRMRHVGIPKADQRAAVITYLKSLPGNGGEPAK